MSRPVDAVIFDIGNVLVRWDPRFLYEKLIADREKLDWFLEAVVPLSWHTQHDAGRPFRETIPERVRQFPDCANLIRAFHRRWDETIAGAIPQSVAVLEDLSRHEVRLYAVTNYSAETFPAFLRRFEFARHFDDIVVSGEVGVVKPDPRIYRIATARFEITPERCLFIDDRIDNVEAARQHGFIPYHFRDPAALAPDLSRLGLPV